MMNFLSEQVTLVASVLSGLGIVLWWLYTRKQDIVIFPILSQFLLPENKRKKLILKKPPLVPFVLFLCLAALFVFLSTKPSIKSIEKENAKSEAHLFIDLSPSVLGNRTIETISSSVSTTMIELKKSYNLTVSTSHSLNNLIAATPDTLGQTIRELGTHRAGLKMGSALDHLLSSIKPGKKIIVITDLKKSTWADVDLKGLAENSSIRILRYPPPENTSSNVFLESVILDKDFDGKQDKWIATIRRNIDDSSRSGQLLVRRKNLELKKVNWTLRPGQLQERLEVFLPRSSGTVSNKNINYLWKLEHSEMDALESDDTYRTSGGNSHKFAYLIGPLRGENLLEDPLNALENALITLGYSAKKIDFLKEPMNFNDPVLALLALNEFNESEACQKKTGGGNFWYFPYSINHFQQSCRCLQRLAPQKSVSCESVADRPSLSRLLYSVGLNQIGGNLGDSSTAVAWSLDEKSSSHYFLTIPFYPSLQSGISHTNFPLLLNQLLTLTKTSPELAQNNWKPVLDIITHLRLGEAEKSKLRNVPSEESMLTDLMSYPKDLALGATDNIQKGASRWGKINDNPAPYIFSVLAIISLILFLEVLYNLFHKSTLAKIIICLLPALVLAEEKLFAFENQIVVFTQSGRKPNFKSLSKTLSDRTTISISHHPKVYQVPDKKLFFEPWIWADQLSTLSTSQNTMKTDFHRWLKAGGLLIIQGNHSIEQLKILTSKFPFPQKRSRWSSIPPDHVIMRSFFLLSSLPSCMKTTWKVFEYDRRAAIIVIPFNLLQELEDGAITNRCNGELKIDHLNRSFVNLTMMAMATDYKKDQIHLKEILKRLR